MKSNIVHLTGKDFRSFLSSKQAVLVIFYAPWCPHCKKVKPAFQGAADKLNDEARAFAAVDCTSADNRGKQNARYWKVNSRSFVKSSSF